MKMRLVPSALLFCAALGSPSATGAAQEPFAPPAQLPLQSAIEQILGNGLDDWGAMAWSLDQERPLFAVNANDIRIPASNNKIFTTVWALDVLGQEHRFQTDLLVSGEIRADGVLAGDVVLRGSGDPTLGYAGFGGDPMEPLRRMARTLRERGVHTVRGAIIADATAFDTALVGPRWPRDTEGGAAAYAPRVSGLAFGRNLLWIELKPTRPGQAASVTLSPDVPEIPVVSTVRTGAGRALAARRADSDTIRVQGAVSGRRSFRYGVGAAQPALLAAGALREALAEAGIAVEGSLRVAPAPPGAALVHRHHSVPLAQILPKLNQDSDNFFAEHLWKATVAHATGSGSYQRGGSASAIFFIEEAGVPPGQLWQADGSGLSADNRASPFAVINALRYADSAPWSDIFHHSLAVAGARGGTLRRLFRNTSAAGNLHAKTGFIRGVRSLSGYVTAENGERIAFSLLYNGRNTNGARSVEQQVGELLATYGGGSGSAPPIARDE